MEYGRDGQKGITPNFITSAIDLEDMKSSGVSTDSRPEDRRRVKDT
jgi:hypothetical protein